MLAGIGMDINRKSVTVFIAITKTVWRMDMAGVQLSRLRIRSKSLGLHRRGPDLLPGAGLICHCFSNGMHLKNATKRHEM